MPDWRMHQMHHSHSLEERCPHIVMYALDEGAVTVVVCWREWEFAPELSRWPVPEDI